MNTPKDPTPKRPYQPPKLRVYGTIREITGNTTNQPRQADGSVFLATKTG